MNMTVKNKIKILSATFNVIENQRIINRYRTFNVMFMTMS